MKDEAVLTTYNLEKNILASYFQQNDVFLTFIDD